MSETTNLHAINGGNEGDEERDNGAEQEQQPQALTLDDVIGRLRPDPGYEPNYEIRQFKGKDTRRLIGLVRKIKNRDEIANASAQGMEAVGLAVFGALLDEVEDEMLPFMADLAGMTVEQADEEPGAVWFKIAHDLMNDEGFLEELRYALRFVAAGKRLFGR